MLSKAQKHQIKSLLKDERWDAVMAYVGVVLDDWQKEPVKAETEFETMWRTAQKEAKMEFLVQFFDRLEKEAIQD